MTIKVMAIEDLSFVGEVSKNYDGDELVLVNRDYNSNYKIRVINPNNGATIKLIDHGLSGWLDESDRILFGDVNGDESDDLVFINTAYNSGAILAVNLNTGGFINCITHDGSFDNFMDSDDKMFLGDVNGDGSKDLIFINPGNYPATIKAIDITTNQNLVWNTHTFPGFLNNNDRSFVGDVNGDGKEDVVLINCSYNSSAVVAINMMTNGYLNVISHGTFVGWMDEDDKMFIEDIDNNGKDDLILANTSYNSGAIRVVEIMSERNLLWLNHNGRYDEWFDECDKMFISDIDGNGYKELLTINPTINGEAIRAIDLRKENSGCNVSFYNSPDIKGWMDIRDKVLLRNKNSEDHVLFINNSGTGEALKIIDLFKKESILTVGYNQFYPSLLGWLDGYDQYSFDCAQSYPLNTLVWDKSYTGDGTIIKDICPVNNQLYPRKSNNYGNVRLAGHVNGKDQIYLIITKSSKFGRSTREFITLNLDENGHFEYDYPINAELSTYKFEYSLNNVDWEIIATNVVCGDAYIIYGQSNASSFYLTDDEEENFNNNFGGDNPDNGNFLRTYGDILQNPYDTDNWKLARSKKNKDGNVGVFGVLMQYNIALDHNIPTCFINGAKGGKSIAKLLPLNKNYEFFPKSQTQLADDYEFFGHMNSRVYMAGLENDIKGVYWWQHDISPDIVEETGDYIRAFDPMYNLWESYYKNYSKAYLIQPHFKIWHESQCRIRVEDFRQMQYVYDNVSVMTADGIGEILEHDLPHFGYDGSIEMGVRLYRLVNRDFFNTQQSNIDPPNIQNVFQDGNIIQLDFDQDISLTHSSDLNTILDAITFNNGYNIKSNPEIIDGDFQFEIDNTNVSNISYSGYMPGVNTYGPYETYNIDCHLNNINNVSAYAFHEYPITQKSGKTINKSKEKISNFDMLQNIKVYPNPASEHINIQFPQSEQSIIRLFDDKGVLQKEINVNADSYIIDCQQLASGNYYFQIVTEKQTIYKKVVVIKAIAI